MNGIQKYNPIAQRKIEEEMNSETEIETKDNQIQHLKDRISIEQGKNRSLQNQIKALKARKKE
jgi:predicted RNase H-like nuclease (RuvC/YqgF family)